MLQYLYEKKDLQFNILVFIMAVVSLIAVGCSNGSNPGTNIAPKVFSVNYTVSEGGYISAGDKKQTIEQGKNGSSITATSNEGYIFTGWSDGVTTETRLETNVQSNVTITANFSKKVLSLKYTADNGGHIAGEAQQNITYGENATSVTATPSEGFLFAGWSDEKFSATRQDKIIKEDIEIKAKFVSKSKTFTYKYNNATATNSQKDITLSYDTLAGTTFAVPIRERFAFNGWYLEPTFKTKVVDENGTLFLGNGVFFTDSSNLYAKWTATETYTYKILMVFVDEIHAQLKPSIGTVIDVNYKMSLVERKVCELIPMQVSKYLNEWFEGLVNFEIDTYFTTVPIGQDSFDVNIGLNNHIMSNNIPEVGPLLKNYRSVITTFNTNDYDKLLHNVSGLGGTKYASIFMEFFMGPLISNNLPLESYFDISNVKWKPLLEVYIHEFTHTVEIGLDVYGYHEVERYYWNQISVLETARLYLLNQAIVDKEIVGIPFEFWQGKIDVPVNYVPSYFGGWDNGKIVLVDDISPPNENSYVSIKVSFGSGLSVEAIPFEGYKFSHWSDGVTTALRHDTNIISYLNVTAIFVKV